MSFIATVPGRQELPTIKLYTTKQAGDLLGLTTRHISVLCRQQHIHSIKLGREWIVLDLRYQRKRMPKGGGNGHRAV